MVESNGAALPFGSVSKWLSHIDPYVPFVAGGDGMPFFEEFQIEYMRREFDTRMMSLAGRLAVHSAAQQETSPPPSHAALLNQDNQLNEMNSEVRRHTNSLASGCEGPLYAE